MLSKARNSFLKCIVRILHSITWHIGSTSELAAWGGKRFVDLCYLGGLLQKLVASNAMGHALSLLAQVNCFFLQAEFEYR
jgi:hypothetical protein